MWVKIPLTGGTGFIGGHAASQLATAGAVTAAIDDLSTGTEPNLRNTVDGASNVQELFVPDVTERNPGHRRANAPEQRPYPLLCRHPGRLLTAEDPPASEKETRLDDPIRSGDGQRQGLGHHGDQ